MFQFSCRFAFFIKFSSFKPDTENNANTLYQANATTLMQFSKEGRILIQISMNIKVTMLGSL